ncbi:hypothetical protein [Planotetraspora kaengkrachanensis]|uniref:DUF4386 domain-containing protein n=1 Tax=Planotetraspora kaengkrachanensis TaxID=575193 RepID=A0A8J3VBR7_9ACTN|nr:hypothetical protein [Planotetraspora kaengkrachanensis]GIG84237.1 hypothetical protein Pka01_73640 [Planotetraspora kaengkrachanensis]
MILSAFGRSSRPAAMNEHTLDSPAQGEKSCEKVPGYERLWRLVLAAAIVGGPLGYAVGSILIPAVHEDGATSIAANATADPIINAVHLVAYVIASFLLPLGATGLAYLAYARAPWLATIGGLLAVVGWLPFSALTALDDLTMAMAALPDSSSYAMLLDQFANDAVMGGYLLVYIVGHLVAYVVLAIALRRAGVIPRWAAWSMIASSPLTVAVFVLPGRPLVLGDVALTLLMIGSIPAARAMATRNRLSNP